MRFFYRFISQNKIKILLGLFVIGIVISFIIFLFQPEKIKASSKELSGVYTVESGQDGAVFYSQTYTADFEFNAIAPSWNEKNANESNRKIYLRTSEDKNTWTDWNEIDAIKPQKDNAPNKDRLYAETPIFETGKYFEYKVDLNKSINSTSNPVVSNIKVDYFDSRPSIKQRIGDSLSAIFTVHADGSPNIISRTNWGSPDPNGDLYKNDPSHYWPPVTSQVKQFFVHHTVDVNNSSDFPSIVRAIWQYHAVSLGWGDIGYNYLIDGNGNIYEGRFGGDNVVAGHTLNYNTGSMGVALIGCFQSNNTTCQQLNGGTVTGPSTAMLDSLTTLLAYKAKSYEIDPTATQSFCSYVTGDCLNLNTIAGHRDAYATACPGDLTYNNLGSIRSTTATKVSSMDWSYSVKQTNYPYVNLDITNTATVTFSFKNTGTVTWNKTGTGRMLLFTANPANHLSPFQSDTWENGMTVGTLNEDSVPPGGTGTFTVKFTKPTNPDSDTYYEYVKLYSEATYDFKNYFTVPISTKVYSSQFTSQTVNISVNPGSTSIAGMYFKNTGNQNWYDDSSIGTAPSGSNPVHLATSHSLNRSSIFANNWSSASRPNLTFTKVYESDGVTLSTDQHIVNPGQIAYYSISFAVQSSQALGQYTEYFQPILENYYNMNDTNSAINITVTNDIPTPTPTPTPTLTPSPTPILLPYKNYGDLDGNDLVDLSDLSILVYNWNTSSPAADINGDGKVDISDLSIVAANWKKKF